MTNFDEQVNGHTPSKLLQISEMVPTTQPNPPTLEKVKSLVPSEAGASTYNERPASFGPLWKEVTIVLLCCCGPITQVFIYYCCGDADWEDVACDGIVGWIGGCGARFRHVTG
jgi:hypothetical protein